MPIRTYWQDKSRSAGGNSFYILISCCLVETCVPIINILNIFFIDATNGIKKFVVLMH